MGMWANTAAISRVQVFPTAGSTFVTGSRATLYGMVGTLPAAGGHSYLGYDTVGGSVETMTINRMYAKKITVASDSLLASIDAHIRTNTADHAGSFCAGVLTDSSGAPDLVMSNVQNSSLAVYLSKAGATNGSFRWFSVPSGIWLPAGDYWVYVQHFPSSGGSSIDIHYDGSGADRYQTPSFNGVADWAGLYSPTTSSNRYSIRANMLG
jgi:hypothetical protein